MSMLSSTTMLRRVASVAGRRLRNTADLAQYRAFGSKFNDLEQLQKKENIIEVGDCHHHRQEAISGLGSALL